MTLYQLYSLALGALGGGAMLFCRWLMVLAPKGWCCRGVSRLTPFSSGGYSSVLIPPALQNVSAELPGFPWSL